MGCASLLVFSGVTDASILLAAPPGQRPDYIAEDLAGLLHGHPGVEIEGRRVRCGSWAAERSGSAIVLMPHDRQSTGPDPDDRGGQLDALRALCELMWAEGSAELQARDPGASAVLDRLGLTGSVRT